MLGIISSRPCDAVNVVVSAPVCSAPWTRARGAALALHLDDVRHLPQTLVLPSLDHWSASSAIVEDGVIG